jgi:hypothetical protein
MKFELKKNFLTCVLIGKNFNRRPILAISIQQFKRKIAFTSGRINCAAVTSLTPVLARVTG